MLECVQALRSVLVCILVALVALAACGDDEFPAKLQPDDFKALEGEDAPKFDRNKVTDLGVFTDIETIKEAPDVQKIFERTPYGGRSFLGTYQSNGVRAADAVVRAARQHRINPLVLIVFAQITEGLLGARD